MLYRFDDVVVNAATYQAMKGGRGLSLQPKMFELLCHLIEHRDRVVTRDELLQTFWPNEHVGDAVVTWTVSHIRKQLGQGGGSRRPIETVHGRGYRFAADLVTDGVETEVTARAAVGAGMTVSDVAPKPQPPPQQRQQALPFVGRSPIMRRLESALTSAIEGRGHLCVLTGEAGIGKTRCARETIALAQERGVTTLVGCSVEGAGAPVFWPWLQVLRQLAGVDTEVRERARSLHAELSTLGGAARGDTAEQASPERRFWLFDQLAALLLDHAGRKPIAILLDDIHWADQGTLDALRFLATELDHASILVLATERDAANHASGRARLVRSVEQLHLTRLTVEDIRRYVDAFAEGDEQVAPEVAEAIHAATAGNPLFIEETVRNLVALHGRDLVSLSPDQVRPPTIVRDVLLVRLNGLPEATRAALTGASVLGETFDLSMLEGLTGESMDALVEALQPAVEAAFVVAESPHRYSFSHALYREVLYDAMPSASRVAAHRRAALHLAAQPAVEGRYAELARHYYRSLPAGDFPAVVRAACNAAEAARTVSSHADAARFYQWALEAQALDPELTPRERAELLLTTGLTERHAGRDRAARQTLKRMFELARQHDYADLLLQGAAALRPTFMLGTVPDTLARDCLEYALSCAPEGPDPTRIGALALLAGLPPYSGNMRRAKQMCGEALSLARERGERKPLVRALRASFYAMSGPEDTDRLLELVDEVLADTKDVSSRAIVDAYAARAGALFTRGDITGGDAALEAIAQYATKHRLEEVRWYSLRQRAQRHFREGNFALADAAANELSVLGERLGLSYGPVFVATIRHAVALERTGIEPLTQREAYAGLPAGDPKLPIGFRTRLTRAAAEAGLVDIAEPALSALAANHFEAVPRELGYLSHLSHLVLASMALPKRPFAAELYALLEPYANHNTPDALLRYEGSVSRYLALLAASLGWHDRVSGHFEDALRLNERLSHLPILARTRFEYAQWLEARDDAQSHQVKELVWGAIDLAERSGMAWLVKAARALL